MSLAQGLFLLALTVTCLIIVGFVVVVLAGAVRADGGAKLTSTMLLRLTRPTAERIEVHRWAFYAHRCSGFGLFAFLLLHVGDVALYAVSPGLFDEVHAVYGTPVMRTFECLLLVALLFHALNGLRVVAVDAFDLGPQGASRLLGGVVTLTAVGGLVGSSVILAPVFA